MSLLSTDKTWSHVRTASRADEMPLRLFMACLSFYVGGGLALSVFAGTVSYNWAQSGFLGIGCFCVALLGVAIIHSSKQAVVSTIGYAIIAASMGLMCGPFVAMYTAGSVEKVAVMTIMVTAVIGIGGTVYPKSVEHWGGFLFYSLLLLIVAQFAEIFLMVFNLISAPLAILDWVGVFLFSAYIFYDMNRAMRMPRTLDNVAKVSAALYLDILNIFLRLLSIFGDKRVDD
jgi:FtsH-binding integral membrane protein